MSETFKPNFEESSENIKKREALKLAKEINKKD